MSSPKVIIVTGASRGIGLVVAQYLLQKSHNLVVVARSESPLRELEKQYPGQVAVLAGDMSDLNLGKQSVDLAHERWQRLDSVVVNHGVLDPVTKIADADVNAWKAAYDITFFSAVAIAKAAIPALRASQGRIIFTSSGAATNGYQGWGAYGSSKAALNHLSSTLATEEKQITSIALRPGVVDTEMQRDIREKHSTAMDQKDAEKFASLKQSNGLLTPEQPGHAIAKLALHAPHNLSGKFLNWDAPELNGI